MYQNNIDIAKTDVKKAYTFRIFPTRKQETKMNRTLSTCRRLYNDALEERRRQTELNNLKRDFGVFPWGKPEWITYEDQQNALPESKTPLQKEVYSQVLQNALKRLDRSFQNFFRGHGYPRFKGRDRYNTFTYPQKGFELDGMKLILSKIGINTRTGVDVGLESLLTLSNGEQIEPPEFYRKSEQSLAWEQRKLSNQRKDFNHKKSKKLIEYDYILFEDLQIKNMVQNHCLAKSILDAGWGQIIRFTAYKAEYAGKTIELVDPHWKSQTCICGADVPKDHVSAIIIENRGKLNNVPTDCGEFTPVEMEPLLCKT